MVASKASTVAGGALRTRSTHCSTIASASGIGSDADAEPAGAAEAKEDAEVDVGAGCAVWEAALVVSVAEGSGKDRQGRSGP